MAGHSQFKNIMHRKGAQDKKRAKLFTKLVKEIYVSAKNGIADPEMNPALRNAINNARTSNLPKDRIEAAIKKASSGGEGENYEAIRYEGYGPEGVAIIVEALTDNRNRTASDIRSTFAKSGGNLGESGSVNFQFMHKGIIIYPANIASEEQMIEHTINIGAENCELTDSGFEIICEVKDFHQVTTKINTLLGEPEYSGINWIPVNYSKISNEKKPILQKLIDQLEDLDDVQNVYHNAESL